ncbi:DUF3039 domain-containing protein [Propionibacteriaceae bacterium Y1923]
MVDLHPLSHLDHPVIAKASSSFGSNPAEDNYECPIHSCTTVLLLEIKQSQWRGGVWQDPETGVNWLVVAGLAKGDHQDHEDFYKRVEREERHGDPSTWLPTPEDERLLKLETAARIRTEWELGIQSQILEILQQIHAGGCLRRDFNHLLPTHGVLARVEVTVTQVREGDYEADEVFVEVFPTAAANHDLVWTLVQRILISIEPPEQGWDRYRDTYATIGEPGAWASRVEKLAALVAENNLAVSDSNAIAHYAHKGHIGYAVVHGKAVRALCGPFFVPRQDHASLPTCPTCEQRLAELPG